MEATEPWTGWPPDHGLAKSPVPPPATTVGELGIFAVCHARPNSRLVPTARTRQVTVNRIICGVDVSKDWLDAHVEPGGAAGRFGNDADGIAELGAFCGGHAVDLWRWRPPAAASAGLPASVAVGPALRGAVNARKCAASPRRWASWRRPTGSTPAVIAHYAAVKKVAPTPPPSAARQRLGALVSRLRQVTGDIVVNKQRRARHATTRCSTASRRSSSCSSARSAGSQARSPR